MKSKKVNIYKEGIKMDKLPFCNKTTDYATMGKKGNMIYWDAIDDLCERFTQDLLIFSVPEVDLDDDTILSLQNQIRDFAVELLEKESAARFPYIDENY
jgi:hypothetical protein